MAKTNPFSQILANKNPGDISRAEDDAWEHARVRHLLKKMGLSKETERKVAKECERFCGDPKLRFDVFNDMFPSFPFRLSANRLRRMPLHYNNKETPGNYQVHADPTSFEPERYKQFERVPFVIAFRDFQEEIQDDTGTLGLVFPRRGFAQGMIIHNEYSEQYWLGGSCWVYKDQDGNKLFVQPFDALLLGIKKQRWKP